MKSFLSVCVFSALLLGLSACSSPFVTNTPRSAVEQMLICSVIERAIQNVDLEKYQGKSIYPDYSYLAPQVDKSLVQAYVELHMANNDIVIQRDQSKADFVVQVACGILATDVDKFLVGTPALPIPVPETDLSIVIPEIPLFMKFTRSGYGRFFFTITDAKTAKPVETIAGANAVAKYCNWVVLLIPFKTTNNITMDEEVTETTEFSMPL